MRTLSVILLALPALAQVSQPIQPGERNVTPFAPAAVLARPQIGVVNPGRTGTPGRTLYRWSIAAVVAANAADAATSFGNREANPFLAAPGTRFGTASLAIKYGFTGGSLLMQHLVLRHRPDLQKRLAWLNFVTAGAQAGAAAHNSMSR